MYPWINPTLDFWLQSCEKKCGLYMDVYSISLTPLVSLQLIPRIQYHPGIPVTLLTGSSWTKNTPTETSFCHYVAKKKKGRLQVCIRKRHKSCPTILYPQVLQSNLYGKTCKGHIRVDMTYLGHTCLVASRIKLGHNVVNKMNVI